MTKFLGTPYERGKSDAIVTREAPVAIEEGLIVQLSGEHTCALIESGKIPYGIAGKPNVVAQEFVISGLRVYAQTDDESVTIGAPVYVNMSTGKVTATAEGNTAVNAVFSSEVVDCQNSKRATFKGVAIDFPNGL